jgi:hypothetical protein
MAARICLKIEQATASIKSRGFRLVTAIMAKILKNLEHFLTFTKLHDGVNFFGEVVNVDLVDSNDIFML